MGRVETSKEVMQGVVFVLRVSLFIVYFVTVLFYRGRRVDLVYVCELLCVSMHKCVIKLCVLCQYVCIVRA